uniref:Dipeptidyl aminopeptidases/acylaminoacyl-peptidases n=1 Tax=uncultured Chloroflexi bacterium HF0500_03M05 TaxID=710737 RepID=E0XY60_9CHLR|nr:dipeptidyl aminopeptidases/acylaminoacyl-peptidases [uncultured Chloroflexi bacterium HF0500_03M05]
MRAGKILSPEDVLSFKAVSDAQLSPDGSIVAYVVADPYKIETKYPRSNIWVVPTDGGDATQLTFGPRSDLCPRWSPDGQSLVFLSDRTEDGQRQLYLLPMYGGEAAQLTTVEGSIPASRSVDTVAWSPDGRKIAFMKTDAETEQEKLRQMEKDDAIEFERNPKYTRINVVDVDTQILSWVSPDDLQVWEFCWSPSGEEFAVVVSDLPFEQHWYTCRLATFSIDGGQIQNIHFSKRQIAKPTWSPDNGSVAFLSSNWSDRGITSGSVIVVPVPDCGKTRDLSGNQIASVNSVAWSDDSQHLLTVTHERGGTGLSKIEVNTGERILLWHGDVTISETSTVFSMDHNENIAVVLEDSVNPQDVWLAKRTANGFEWARLTNHHPQATDFDLGVTESIHWKGADGWDMHGLLIRPVMETIREPHPMVTIVHGGPTGMLANRFYAASQGYQLLAAKGMAVFLPNYRGSTGWGIEFAESNIGDMGGKDWEDILMGIDHCVKNGIADVERLGISGGSYGGFMTSWAITQTDQFKAAVMIAGISDWRSFHGKSHLCDWDSIHYGDADPWDPDGLYRKFSPITHVKRVKTPTLILHGEEDLDVPVEQSYIFYRALKDLGVETELVVYPREPHGFNERNHKLDQARRTTDWFAERLFS